MTNKIYLPCGNKSEQNCNFSGSSEAYHETGFSRIGGVEYNIRNLQKVNKIFYIISRGDSLEWIEEKQWEASNSEESMNLKSVVYLPACSPENMGDPDFCRDYGVRYPYYAGSMAHGISSEDMVESLARAGILSFFGTAGLTPVRVESAIDRQSGKLGDLPHGYNLIHTPNEPNLESSIVDLYIKKNVHLIEASAYLSLTLPIIRFRVNGIHRNSEGEIVTPNRIIAKVSRVEVAARFFSPPPENYLQTLLDIGEITQEQADLARQIPVAQDITAEADSGGHTDNRPAITLLPTIMALRDRLQAEYKYSQKLRVGLGGGISTPASAVAAFAMGAAFIVTGSVNQACVESGTSPLVREMLAQTEQADVTMAPAADMFEMGVKLQVLKRGTMFPMRSHKLYELYENYDKIEDIPAQEILKLEKTFFRSPIDKIWEQTCTYFNERDKTQIERASRDPKYKTALIFRWYLGQSSHWATAGDESRRVDYQIWCGPSMGAFNEWTKGTFLEKPQNRKVVTVALNILHGAAVIFRLNFLRMQGFRQLADFTPLPLEERQIREFLT